SGTGGVVAGADSKPDVVWQVATGKAVRPITGTDNSQMCTVMLSRDGQILLVAGTDPGGLTARIYSVTDGNLVTELKGHTGQIANAWLSPDGTTAVTSGRDETFRVWDARTGQARHVIKSEVGGG